MKEEVRNRLKELAEEEYRKFHSGLCPNVNNILGVRVPKLRHYAKELAKGNYQEYLKEKDLKYYEEILLQGMIIGIANIPVEERFIWIQEFIPKIDNWAICDTFCAGLKFTKKYPKEVWDFLQVYLKSQKEFEVRFGIVMLLDYFIKEEYIDEVLQKLDKISQDKYYVKMAVAWAISIAYIKFPERTKQYLWEECHLSKEVYHKAIQKIVESTRITKEEKQEIKSWKK